MKKIIVIALTAVFCIAIPNEILTAQFNQPKGQAIAANFFGMSTHWYQPWPLVPFAQIRLWGTGTTWAKLNPIEGIYDWTKFDKWLETAEANHTEILYTIAFTPTWASSKPGDVTCREGLGECDPPNDVNPDGSGSDQHWKDFITAVATHAAGRIKYWEIWNEPLMSFYWTGTSAQLARLAKDARTIILSIDPTAKLLSPPNAAGGPGAHWVDKWWYAYEAAGGFQYADIIALHGGVTSKCGEPPKAADFIPIMQDLRRMMALFHQDKPIWDTESNWGKISKDCFTDQDLQAAFLGQFYLLHVNEKVERFYWYSYNDPNTGELYDVKTGKLTKGGIALQQIYPWLVGRTLTQACSATGSIWTCGLHGPGGYKAEVIWDTDKSCHRGSCETENYKVDTTYTQYRTLSGEKNRITKGLVPIGAKPILVEN